MRSGAHQLGGWRTSVTLRGLSCRRREGADLLAENCPAAHRGDRELDVDGEAVLELGGRQYRFSSEGLVGVAVQTVRRCVERMTRLYEQGADFIRIDDYVRCWFAWERSGSDSLPIFNPSSLAAVEQTKTRRVPAVPTRVARGWRVRGRGWADKEPLRCRSGYP